jgi:hypothetical protein
MTDIGGGVMQTDCSMRSLDMCRQEVIAGKTPASAIRTPLAGSPTAARQPRARRQPR